jgi:hypothetical protein
MSARLKERQIADQSPNVFANDGPRHVQLWFLKAMGLEKYYTKASGT